MDTNCACSDEKLGHYQRRYKVGCAELVNVVAKLVIARVEEGEVEQLGGSSSECECSPRRRRPKKPSQPLLMFAGVASA